MTDRTKWLSRKTAKGRQYLYFRLPSGKLLKLPPENSPAFVRAYDACVRLMKQEERKAAAPTNDDGKSKIDRGGPASIDAAIMIYRESAAFAKLRPSTKLQYEYTLSQIGARLGHCVFTDLDTDGLDIHCEQVAMKQGATVADRHLRVISKIWKVCRKHKQFGLKGKFNPTIDAERHYTGGQKYRPWPAEVQADFMSEAPDRLKLAKLLLHFGAQRGGDCIKMKWSDYDGRGLRVRPEKIHGEAEAQANYHLCPKPLREALDKAKPHATGDTILVNGRGEPYQNTNVLSAAIRRTLVRLGHAKPGQRTFVMHGLRKNAASEVASLGVGAAGVKSVTGHRSDREANEYAAFAEKERINAMVVELWDAEIERQRRGKLKVVK